MLVVLATDYAAEHSRYLDIIGIAIAYRCSDGTDVGMVNLIGLERQAEQQDARPSPRKRQKRLAAASANEAQDSHAENTTETSSTS